ncbi:MAG: zinc metallopeptidase [Spirochaetia bacterium]|nr:zinc metallopeptidase [Spirochaetia bacterium]
MIFDPLYLMLMAPAMILSAWASLKVKSSFNKYSKYRTQNNMTGADAARAVLDAAGISNVRIERVSGFLSDHYDPSKKVLRLSPDVYDSPSVSAVGVGAHEAGHAIQDKVNYPMLTFRTMLVPTASFGSNMSWIILMAGFFLNMTSLIWAGIILFSAVVLFQLITLPVEFDASARAKKVLWESGVITTSGERDGVAKVLNAAAMTYVAAAISAILTLIYFLIRAGLLGGSRDE